MNYDKREVKSGPLHTAVEKTIPKSAGGILRVTLGARIIAPAATCVCGSEVRLTTDG